MLKERFIKRTIRNLPLFCKEIIVHKLSYLVILDKLTDTFHRFPNLNIIILPRYRRKQNLFFLFKIPSHPNYRFHHSNSDIILLARTNFPKFLRKGGGIISLHPREHRGYLSKLLSFSKTSPRIDVSFDSRWEFELKWRA